MTRSIKNLPNVITALRMFGTILLIFTKPLTLWFFIIYTFTGVTDILDGFIARKFKLTSEFGAKLDSVADLLFYAVMLIKIFPILLKKLPLILWVLIVFALLFRVLNYITVAVKTKQFASTHSVFNKITGFCVFVVPFILNLTFSLPIFIVFSIIGFSSSLVELLKSFLTLKKIRV